MSDWKIKGRRPKYPNEAWVKKQVKDQLEKLKIWYFMPNGGYFGVSGIPDFICCHNMVFKGIEAKDADGKWSQAQQDKMTEITIHGGFYYLVDENGLYSLWKLLSKGPSYFHSGFFDLRGADDKAT